MVGLCVQFTNPEKRMLERIARAHRRSQVATLRWLVELEAERLRQEKKTAITSTAGQPTPEIAEE